MDKIWNFPRARLHVNCDVLGCLLGSVYIMGLFVTVIIFSFICPHAVLLRRRRSFTSRKRYVCQETFYVSWSGGGVLLEKSGWVCGPLHKTLTLFMTKICDFPYPIYDVTKNLIPYLWPDHLINSLFQTCLKIISLLQTNVEGNIYLPFCGWKEGDMMKK